MLRLVRGIVLVATFVGALVLGVFVHWNTGPFRRDAVTRVNQILEPLFAGRVTLVAIGHLGLRGVDGVSARVSDPAGVRVLVVEGVQARANVVAIVRSALLGPGPIVIGLEDVRVRSAEVRVDVDADGSLGIARAFLPKTPSLPTATPGRGVRLSIDRVTLEHAWVHGHPVPGNALAVDGDVDALRGKLLVAPPNLALDVDSLTLATREMPAGANAQGTLTAHLAMPSASAAALGVSADWKGSIGGVEDTVHASLDGDACEAVVDAPSISPDAIRAFWPASPIAAGASAHVVAKGTLTRMELDARATLGASSFEVTGPVAIAGGQHADLHLDVRALDLNALVPSAPPSSLAAKGTLSITRGAAGDLEGEAKIDLEPGLIAGEPIPPGAVHGSVKYDAKGGLRADARISAREPGAPTVLAVHLSPKRNGALQIAFDADLKAPQLESVPRLRSAVSGSTVLQAHGVVDLEKGEIEAKAKGEIDDFGQGGAVHARHASIALEASGTLASPRLDVTLHGDVLDVAGYRFSSAHVEAHGPPKHVHLSVRLRGDDAPDVETDADVGLVARPTVSNLVVAIARNGDALRATAASVRAVRGGIDLEDVVVTGVGGTLHASLHTTTDTLRVKADGRDLDVAALARLARVEDALTGCRLALDVDAAIQRDGAEGTASFDLGSCSRDKFKEVTAHLDASVKGRRISGHARVDVPDAGVLDLETSSIQIGGTAPVLASFRRAWGKVKFAGHMDLARVAGLLPPGLLPFDDLRGTLALDGKLERDAMDDMTPGLALSLKTAGLSVVGASERHTGVDGATTIVPPAWRLTGIDVALDSRIDGDSGFADVDVRMNDVKGELVDVDLKSATVPFSNLLATPAQSVAILESVQFNARVTVPKRKLEDLPAELGSYAGHGEIEGSASVTGAVRKPILDADVRVTGAHGRESGLVSPADFELKAHYDGAHADAKVTATVKEDRVLEGKVSIDAAMSDLLARDFSSWTASSQVHLEEFPLGALSALNDHEVQGTLDGDVTLDGLHRDASLKVDLTVNALKAGAVTYLSGKLGATVGASGMDASLRFDQTDGFIDLHAHAGARWGAAIAPTLDPTKDLDCTLTADRFRAAILLPYVDDVFTELDARVNANVTAQLDPRSRTAKVNGSLAVTEGRFELASIGGEFHDASMDVKFTPDGVVRVENVRASGLSGRISASAVVRLVNLVPVAANANIEVPSSSPLLLTVEGAQIGTIVGKMSIVAKASPNAITADVDVPSLHVELPLTSSQDVQVLGDIPNVRIGTNTSTGFVPERLDAARLQLSAPSNKTMKVTVNLGRDVEVKRGATLKVALEGKPTITVANDVQASGQIRLVRGTIDVQGKSFELDNGTVSFVGDPSNPQIVVTAEWAAPEGTRVYADFVGPLKTGKVTLRSDPTLSQSEILALLLFGTTEASPNSQTSSASTTAGAGVAGSAAAQPLNRALESFGLGGVSTRIDTSQANPRPEVEVQIARDISLQIAYVIGTPPPGQNPDTTLLTVDWRFVRQWSVETTVGSSGTSILDLVWQHRY